MRPGTMDRRVTIETPSHAADEYGSGAVTWATFATVWAAKSDERGRRAFAAAQMQAVRPTEFRIRKLAGLSPNMRIALDGLTYEIVSIQEIGRGEGHVILADARQGGG